MYDALKLIFPSPLSVRDISNLFKRPTIDVSTKNRRAKKIKSTQTTGNWIWSNYTLEITILRKNILSF